jgi:hypothetical protein
MVWYGVVWCGVVKKSKVHLITGHKGRRGVALLSTVWFKLNDMPQYDGLFLNQLKMEHVINNEYILKHDVSCSPSFLVKE